MVNTGTYSPIFQHFFVSLWRIKCYYLPYVNTRFLILVKICTTMNRFLKCDPFSSYMEPPAVWDVEQNTPTPFLGAGGGRSRGYGKQGGFSESTAATSPFSLFSFSSPSCSLRHYFKLRKMWMYDNSVVHIQRMAVFFFEWAYFLPEKYSSGFLQETNMQEHTCTVVKISFKNYLTVTIYKQLYPWIRLHRTKALTCPWYPTQTIAATICTKSLQKDFQG